MADPALDLYWIPLGAGARVVRASGRIYERIVATRDHRPPGPLVHSALVATTDGGRFTIEMTPIPGGDPPDRGVVGTGAVGSCRLGRFRVFRYEVRCWRDGVIPDLGFAVASPVRLADDPAVVIAVVDLVGAVPTPVWGRDELRTGEMWNSNSVVSWALTHAGLVEAAGRPPDGGRAPGWDAGVEVARRSPVAVGATRRR
jgi:hypothetical protein